MARIICVAILLTLSNLTQAEQFANDVQQTLSDIMKNWVFFNEVSCGNVTLTSYDNPNGIYNSLLFKLHGKTIAFDISKGEFSPVYIAALIENKWEVNTDPGVFSGDVMIMKAAQSHGLTVSDLGQCTDVILNQIK